MECARSVLFQGIMGIVASSRHPDSYRDKYRRMNCENLAI